ncbi:MAG: hypothetical protein HQK99_14600 [Nitrospirae bacterium]|nr:hypothetical protein [Nitrospirota bacterium]
MAKKREQEERVSVSFRLLPDVVKSLRYISVAKDITLSDLVENILIQYANANSMQIDTAIKKHGNTVIPDKQPETSLDMPDIPKKPVQEKTAPKHTPKGKHDWPSLWSEYQEMKAANPDYTEAEFSRAKGLNKTHVNKCFKPFKAAHTPNTAPIKQPEHLSAPVVGTVGKAD